jgi:hypothetical protein
MLRKAKKFNDSNRTFRLTQYVLQNTVKRPTFQQTAYPQPGSLFRKRKRLFLYFLPVNDNIHVGNFIPEWLWKSNTCDTAT